MLRPTGKKPDLAQTGHFCDDAVFSLFNAELVETIRPPRDPVGRLSAIHEAFLQLAYIIFVWRFLGA